MLFIVIAAGAAYQVLSLVMTALFTRKRAVPTDREEWPPVSVLKPVCGKDEQLRENLHSFCTQEYPQYEVLIGFGDHNDEAIPIAEGAVRSFPGRARVIVAEGTPGGNRKVANLIGLERQSRFELLAISDSDMRVGSDYLKTIVREYLQGNRIGLVTSPYLIHCPVSIGSTFEALTVACDLFPGILVARSLQGMNFGLGASLLLSKQMLLEIGGLPEVADYLADDYQIGYRIDKTGHSVILSQYILDTRIGPITLADHVRHQLRWAVTYRVSRPKGHLGYGITHVFPLALIFSLFRKGHVLALPAGAFLLRAALVLFTHVKLLDRKSIYKSLICLPFKDLLAFGIWSVSWFQKTVSWRGRRYKITKDGKLKERKNKLMFQEKWGKE